MSKDIDLSGGVEGLSDDDLHYLAARDNQDAVAELAKRDISVDGSLPTPVDQIPNTGDANTAGETIESLEAKLAQMRAEQASDEDGEDDEEGLEAPYDEHTNDELRAEIARRNENRDDDDQLSLQGKKDELVAELERDDAESEED